MTPTTKLIAHHMRGIQRAKDGRGRYLNQLALYNKLRESGSDSIAMTTAQAAVRVAMAVEAASKARGA